MAEARHPESTPLSPIDIFSLYWDDEILEKTVESIDRYVSIKRKLLPAMLCVTASRSLYRLASFGGLLVRIS